MAWSKVKRGPKPIGWWYRKLMCELCYSLGWTTYYYQHLNKMLEKHKLNLYGQPLFDRNN